MTGTFNTEQELRTNEVNVLEDYVQTAKGWAVEFFFKVNTHYQHALIMHQISKHTSSTTNTGGHFMIQIKSNTLRPNFWDGTTESQIHFAHSIAANGAWHHFYMVVPHTYFGQASVYIDGTALSRESNPGYNLTTALTNVDFNTGSFGGSMGLPVAPRKDITEALGNSTYGEVANLRYYRSDVGIANLNTTYP